MYAFYEPLPTVQYKDGRRAHAFRCARPGCKVTRRRFLDTKDASSTGLLWSHARTCWGEDAIAVAHEFTTAGVARPFMEEWARNGRITTAFAREAKKGVETYSTIPLSKTETRLASWLHREGYRTYIVSTARRSSAGFARTFDPSKLSRIGTS